MPDLQAPLTPALSLSEIIGGLSFALDLKEGHPPGHCLRCAWIGLNVGWRLDLPAAVLSDIHDTLLLKDTGCAANAQRLRHLCRDSKTPERHALAVAGVAAEGPLCAGKAGFPERRQDPGRRAGPDPALCLGLLHGRRRRSAAIVRHLGFSSEVAAGVCSLDEHWDGSGAPDGLAGLAIPLPARMALLAQVVDVVHAEGGPAAACREVRRRSGTWLDPNLVAAFEQAQRARSFWRGLAAEGLARRVAAIQPPGRIVTVDEARLDAIAAAFAEVVDAKGGSTGGHGWRVADYAVAIAARLGWPAPQQRRLRRAALLHDIGKLAVSNEILDKPGKLDPDEWAAIHQHPAMSEQILGRIAVFRDLAAIAGAHHERLDGKGYPKGLAAEAIPLEARIITTADIFDALIADRPYRGPLPPEHALALMERERGTVVDGRCLDALKAYLRTAGPHPAAAGI
ncbi:MAG: HD domain-containing protein [Rhodospirillales bacterium]|nr:HD domain-containing protein [Rhodospirillales bacterium]